MKTGELTMVDAPAPALTQGIVVAVGGISVADFRDEKELLATAATRVCEWDAMSKSHASEMVKYALQTGALLLAVSERLPHGTFLLWLTQKCPSVSKSTAYNYMKFAGKKQLEFEANAAAGLPQTEAVDERSLTELYIEYGIVKRPKGWGGSREGSGRPKKDPAAEVAAAAADPDLSWAEAGGFLKGLYDFGMERDGFGALADDDLESLSVMLAALSRRADELLAARRRKGN